RRLAREHAVEADVVIPVPDSGIAAAIGYARESGIPYDMGLIRSHYVGRTFIEPQQSIRHFGVKLKLNGAREVHVRISSPPTTHPCYYGIDTPTRSELIASSHSVDEIARYVTCDSLGYLSVDGLMRAVGSDSKKTGYCAACFTGDYPVAFDTSEQAGKLIRLRR